MPFCRLTMAGRQHGDKQRQVDQDNVTTQSPNKEVMSCS